MVTADDRMWRSASDGCLPRPECQNTPSLLCEITAQGSMAASLDVFSLLVDLRGSSDLMNRPAYRSPLYDFAGPYPYGSASCRQPHQHVFLIVTADGAKTNVGKNCSRRIFWGGLRHQSKAARQPALWESASSMPVPAGLKGPCEFGANPVRNGRQLWTEKADRVTRPPFSVTV